MFTNSTTKKIWGLYVEETCINAIKVSKKAKNLFVEAFDTVKYSELDSSPKQQTESEPNIQFRPFPIDEENITPENTTHSSNIKGVADLVKKAISLFLTRNQIHSSDKILIALPAQFVLSRFVNLPSVKKSQLKNIVRFEVEKHIPIDINEIIWDFHSLDDKPVPGKEIEIGIFAIKKEYVYSFLSSFQSLKDHLTTIQIGSIAFYNFFLFNEKEMQPTMLLEIGIENTNLMVINREKIWTRNIPSTDLGSNFIDEIKRSTGYYKTLVKEIEIKYLIVTGTLSKHEEKKRFISQSLGYELKEICLMKNNIDISNLADRDRFNSNISRFIIPLGLAIQGLSLGKITLNLIPEEFARNMVLAGKKKIVLVSSIIILVSVLILSYGQLVQNKKLLNISNSGLGAFNKAVNLEKRYKNKETEYNKMKQNLDQIASAGEGRTFWDKFIPKLLDAIPGNTVFSNYVSEWITSPEKALSMTLNGKSFNPRLGFIDEKIKTPLEEMVLNDNGKEIPIFENIKIVPDSIQHDRDGISFEIKWTVKYKTFLLLSTIDE